MTATHEEVREHEITERASKHLVRLRSQLQAGNRKLASEVGEAIGHLITDEILDEQVIYAAMPHPRPSPRFQKLVEQALENMAEVAAIKEVEQIEKQRDEAITEARVERREFARYWAAHA